MRPSLALPLPTSMLFEHLIDPDFDALADLPTGVAPAALLNAKVSTLDWLDEPLSEADQKSKTLAREAFGSVTDPNTPAEIQTSHIMQLRAPAAVQHLVGMLSAYDWDFVEQAKEIRGYVVAKLLEETKGPKDSTRLRALELLGKVTEVGSFTERIEITRKTEDTSVIEERIRARLQALLPPPMEVQDAEIKDVAIVPKVPRKAADVEVPDVD